MIDNKKIKPRVYTVYIVMCAVALAILGSIFKIQIIEGEQWRTKGENLATDLRTIKATRGNVYSADGSLLATSVPIYEVRMDLNTDALTNTVFYDNVDSLSYCLANFFKDRTKSEYKADLISARKRGARYHLIQRRVDYTQLQSLKEFPLFRRGRYKGGVVFEKQTKRKKPFGLLAARTVGYERDKQAVGLEGAYSAELSGVKGLRLEKRLAGGVWMPIGDANEVEPEDGADLYTTIDVNIQDVAENALMKQLKQHNADHGCVVLMEVKTGRIKAMANLTRTSDSTYYESYNYAVGETTEPGSTFKLASLLAALDDGKITIADTVDTKDGVYYYYDVPMRDSRKNGYGKITVQRAFEVSSNIGVSRVISESYSKEALAFTNKLRSFGLNAPTGIEIVGEGKPQVQTPETAADWSGISLTQMAIGYEVLQTPLQILTFYNAVANNGKMVKPRLADRLEKNGKTIKHFKTEVLNKKICSDQTIKQAKTMLEGVVKRGTAQNLKNAYFNIGGKTGTARIANSKYGYKYNSLYSYQASFVGYFPTEAPLYSCIVVVNAPSNAVYYGNLVAGPIFQEIADKVYSSSIEYHKALNVKGAPLARDIPVSTNGNRNDLLKVYETMGIPFRTKNGEQEWVYTYTQKDSVLVRGAERNVKYADRVPNVKGMGLQDALFLLENSGLKVIVKGYGTVAKQSVKPGTAISGSMEIKLLLS